MFTVTRVWQRRLAEGGRALLGVVYLGGAAVHLFFWATDRAVYAELSPFVLFGWYRDLWTGLVLPNLGVLVPTLAGFELLVGLGVLRGGRWTRAGLVAGALFNLVIAPLGFWWPSNVALALAHLALLRVEFPESTWARLGDRLGGESESESGREKTVR